MSIFLTYEIDGVDHYMLLERNRHTELWRLSCRSGSGNHPWTLHNLNYEKMLMQVRQCLDLAKMNGAEQFLMPVAHPLDVCNCLTMTDPKLAISYIKIIVEGRI